MSVLARLRWRRSWSAALASRKVGDAEATENHYETSLRAVAALPPGNSLRRKSLAALLKLQIAQKSYASAVSTAETLIDEQHHARRLDRVAIATTYTELASLYQKRASHEAVATSLERALVLFREQVAAFAAHGEEVRRLRESAPRGVGPEKIWRTAKLSVAGLRYFSAMLKSLAAYPQALEQLTDVRVEASNIAGALALQRELIDFKLTTDVYGGANILNDLHYVLALQQQHGLFDDDSPRLAQSYVELLETGDNEDVSRLLKAMTFLYAVHVSASDFPSARTVARRGLNIASRAWGESSTESLRWLLAGGESSYAAGEYREALTVSKAVLAATNGDQEARRDEFRRALELEANAERALG